MKLVFAGRNVAAMWVYSPNYEIHRFGIAWF